MALSLCPVSVPEVQEAASDLTENVAVSGIHLTGEPRKEDFVRIATAKNNYPLGD
jgi:hypothetical protein